MIDHYWILKCRQCRLQSSPYLYSLSDSIPLFIIKQETLITIENHSTKNRLPPHKKTSVTYTACQTQSSTHHFIYNQKLTYNHHPNCFRQIKVIKIIFSSGKKHKQMLYEKWVNVCDVPPEQAHTYTLMRINV